MNQTNTSTSITALSIPNETLERIKVQMEKEEKWNKSGFVNELLDVGLRAREMGVDQVSVESVAKKVAESMFEDISYLVKAAYKKGYERTEFQ